MYQNNSSRECHELIKNLSVILIVKKDDCGVTMLQLKDKET